MMMIPLQLRTFVATNSLVVVLLTTFLLLAPSATLALDGIRTLDEEGFDTEQQVYKVPEVPMPKNVIEIRNEGQVYKLRRKSEVVVIAVTQKYDCSKCEETLIQFREASKHFIGRDQKDVQFAVLDAVEEADEFSLIAEENPDFHWMVPAVLVFKASYQFQYRRPPVSFLVNENLARDLPKFVDRFIGPDAHVITSEKELFSRIHHPSTEHVSFGVWPGITFAAEALNRVVERERLHVMFHSILSSTPDYDHLVERFNPERGHLVAYLADSKRGFTVKTLNLNTELPESDFNGQLNMIRNFLEANKIHRPGHEYDQLNVIKVESLHKPQHCSTLVETHHNIRAQIVGVNLITGSKFLDISGGPSMVDPEGNELPPDLRENRAAAGPNGDDGDAAFFPAVIDDGEKRKDLPSYIKKKGFLGMCVGEQRRVILPPNKHYKKEREPPGVHHEDRVQFDIELKEIQDVQLELARRSLEKTQTPRQNEGGEEEEESGNEKQEDEADEFRRRKPGMVKGFYDKQQQNEASSRKSGGKAANDQQQKREGDDDMVAADDNGEF